MRKIKSGKTPHFVDLGRDFPLAEKSDGIIALLDKKGIICFVNKAHTSVLGYSKKELIGRPLCDILYPDFVDKKVVSEVLNGKKFNLIHAKVLKKDGTYVLTETNTQPFSWKHKKYIACFSTDVTERYILEEELRNSKAESDALITYAPVGIYEIDFRGPRFVKVNEAMCKLSGYTKKELLKINPMELLDTQSRYVFQERMRKTFSNEKIADTVDYKVIRKDGSFLYVSLNIRPIYENGKPVGAFVIGSDVTERRKMEEMLLKSEEKYRAQAKQLETIFNNTPVVIWMTNDQDSKYIFGNQTANEFLGVPTSTNVSKSGPDMQKVNHYFVVKNGETLPPDDMPIQRVARTGEPLFDFEMDVSFVDGRTKTLMGNVVPFLDENNHPYGAVGAFIDISERKKVEQQKDEFLAVASHELKTPITSLKAYTQFLAALFTKKGDEKSALYLNKMDAQINKLTVLLNELLDITRIQSGKLQLKLESYNFNELVKETVEQLQLTSSQHAIETELDKDICIFGDRYRVGQVITNLLSNAIKYSPHATNIKVGSKVSSDAVTLSVKDYGLGIDEDSKDRIFERFYRAEGRRGESYPGMGLGLYISSEIIRRHNGKIWFDSKAGKGSTFYISLPLTNTLQGKNK